VKRLFRLPSMLLVVVLGVSVLGFSLSTSVFAKPYVAVGIPVVPSDHIRSLEGVEAPGEEKGLARLEYPLDSDHQWNKLDLLPNPSTGVVVTLYNGYGSGDFMFEEYGGGDLSSWLGIFLTGILASMFMSVGYATTKRPEFVLGIFIIPGALWIGLIHMNLFLVLFILLGIGFAVYFIQARFS
jgi:hypothetical protein